MRAVSQRLRMLNDIFCVTQRALAQVPAPKRAKRVNSRKRFREEEGYDEAEVGLLVISPSDALLS